jgi:hypothetical protein
MQLFLPKAYTGLSSAWPFVASCWPPFCELAFLDSICPRLAFGLHLGDVPKPRTGTHSSSSIRCGEGFRLRRGDMSIATHAPAKQRESKLLRAIRERTKSRVGQLAITTETHRVIIHGHAGSFHIAQLAVSAAREVMRKEGDDRPVRTKIVVDSPKPRLRAR